MVKKGNSKPYFIITEDVYKYIMQKIYKLKTHISERLQKVL